MSGILFWKFRSYPKIFFLSYSGYYWGFHTPDDHRLDYGAKEAEKNLLDCSLQYSRRILYCFKKFYPITTIQMASSRTKKTIIRIIIILFLASSALTSVLYFFPSKLPAENVLPQNDIEAYIDPATTDIVVNGDVDIDHPENNDIQVVITEDETKTDMDQMVEVVLEDGSVDTPTVGDFSDSLQLLE